MTAKQLNRIASTPENLKMLAEKVIDIYNRLESVKYTSEQIELEAKFISVLNGMGIPFMALYGRGRKGIIPDIKSIYCYLMYEKCKLKYEDIADKLNCHHSSVMHHKSRYEAMVKSNDEKFNLVFENFKHLLN